MQTSTKARFVIPLILALLCLLPIATLFHFDANQGWQFNRTLMAEPDEPSYVLMAKSIAAGHGFSTAAITGRDTFYPPGLPLVLAAWGKIFGFTIESLHVCVALTLSLAILLSFFLLQRMFVLWNMPHADRAAIILTALFATSWHVLDNALHIFSEPLFMAALFGWLLAALKLDSWWMRPRSAAIVAFLACAAWLVRSAGVVCFAATILYIVIGILRHRKKDTPAETKSRWLALALAGVIIFAAVFAMHFLIPAAPNSYSQQFFSRLGIHTVRGMWRHLGDFSSALVPEVAWSPEFREMQRLQTPWFILLAPLLLIPCIAGVVCRIARSGSAPTRFVEIFFILYTLLLLLWPFDFVRFWIPLLPLAFAYAASLFRHARSLLKLGLALSVLALSIVQITICFSARQARLNHVSDCLAQIAADIRAVSPDPKHTIICADNEDFFTFSWYLNPDIDSTAYRITSPDPRGRNEPVILRALETARSTQSKIFIVSYFKHDVREAEPTIRLVLENLRAEHPRLFNDRTIGTIRILSNTAAVWEIKMADY